MRKLNELFQELGISKVRLAKYLGVSRQMVYNYLELNDINKWPKDYLMNVESRLNQEVKSASEFESQFDFKGLNKESQVLLSDITYLLKEKLKLKNVFIINSTKNPKKE